MSRPTLDGIKQASVGAFDKAKLMVGLKNNQEDTEEQESQQSERSSFLEDAADLLCPELTFQQRLIGFAACFALGCKWIALSVLLAERIVAVVSRALFIVCVESSLQI